MNGSGGTDLLGDALPLEAAEIDGRLLTFVWFHLSGVDRLTVTSRGERVGVVEHLETREPRLIPDSDWAKWLNTKDHAARVLARATLQWQHRGEIVADRALRDGGQLAEPDSAR
jgi:hypothetical protein